MVSCGFVSCLFLCRVVWCGVVLCGFVSCVAIVWCNVCCVDVLFVMCCGAE